MLDSQVSSSGGLVERVKEVERRIRASIGSVLLADGRELKRVAEQLGLSTSDLKAQLSDLRRVRKKVE